MRYDIPETQYAVQLIGPDKLRLNKAKAVFSPGPHQVLCRVEAVSLCFSDLKLLKQFSSHVRKAAIISGINPEILKEIPSYVPQGMPTVPGHEVVVRICSVGEGVKDITLGERYLVQTDYRWLLTPGSNAAFGYNFEGALQEYVLMDERVITSPEGDSMLIRADEELSASAVALVEPWACVEDSYAVKERRTLKTGGKMLVVAERPLVGDSLLNLFRRYGRPAEITWVSPSPLPAWLAPAKNRQRQYGEARRNTAESSASAVTLAVLAKGRYWPKAGGIPMKQVRDISELKDAAYDDLVYFGSRPETVEALFPKLTAHGLLNIVLSGDALGRGVVCKIGRVHYGGIRIVGTTGSDPGQSMENIPASGELRKGDKIDIIGAAGPMGMMHVIRNICQGVEDISIFAGDVDMKRLAALGRISLPLTKERKVLLEFYNPSKNRPKEVFDYVALMAPIPALISQSIQDAAPHAIINIFAGISGHLTSQIDLDTYIEKRLYFIGTSGSTLEDMRTVLSKVEEGRLDTNLSVAGISGLAGAIEGIRAVEEHLLPGKIVVYPSCKGLGLIPLKKLKEELPRVAESLHDGLWTKEAEDTLLEVCGA